MQLQAIKKETRQHTECHLLPCQHWETTKFTKDSDFRSGQLGSKRGIGSLWAEVRSCLVLTALFNVISQHQQQTSDCKHSELAKCNCTHHKCILRDCPSTLTAQRAQGNAHRAATQCCVKAELTCYILFSPKALRNTYTAGATHQYSWL